MPGVGTGAEEEAGFPLRPTAPFAVGFRVRIMSERDLVFVVQKHAASHLHYDFRLELDGVLLSWAIPKGPSLDPSIKRLAMHVEDHPFEYKDFEGVIPPGNYGAGRVIVWDRGTYRAPGAHGKKESEEILRRGYQKGDLKFILDGTKLKGEFALVRLRSGDGKSWLLLKKHDFFATADDITLDDRSAVTGSALTDAEYYERHPGHKSSEPRKGASRSPSPAPASVVREPPPAPVSPPGPATSPGGAPPAPGPQEEKETQDPMPHDIEPMLATAVKEPFSDPNWLFEIKLDGYRAVAEVQEGKVSLYSRRKLSFNRQFAPIAAALESLGHDAVLDGEIVILDEQGRSSFQLLQNYQRTGSGNLCYYVFDLLYLDGKNLCNLPLVTRKQTLRTILAEGGEVRFSDHIPDDGTSFYQIAAGNSLEGIIAKKNDSRYFPGRRSREWLKIKITRQQEAVICGYTRPRGSRKYFRSLVLGVYEGGALTYIGLCGGGFDEATLKEVSARLEPLIQPESPFPEAPPAGAPVTWVRPQLVCEVVFAEWTDEQVMRQPVFLGMRPDKDPRTVTRERELELQEALSTPEPTIPPPVTPASPSRPSLPKKEGEVSVEGRRLRLTNLDKLFWPEEGYTKGDVVEYYLRIAPLILPHLKDRPQSLYRTPEGMSGEGFFQKEAGELPPEWVGTKEIFSRSNNKNIKFFLCQDAATLIYMANLGCVEINPWLSRIDSLDNPDYIVIDLDPEAIDYEKVVEAALAVREILTRAGAASFPKTSGSRGMHIYVPLAARYGYDTAGKFAELVANLAHQLVPGFTSLVRSPGKRQRKVYFDYLQNRRGQTIAAPYSLRVRPGAPVSTPLAWEEVRPGLDPRAFTIRSVHERLAQAGDIFSGVLGPGVDLAEALERLQK